MPLTDFQLKKVNTVYQNLYDSNKDGVIDHKDFKDAVEKISKLHHWGKNTEQYDKAQSTLDSIWEGLRKYADKNKDNIVTREEWANMWTDTLGKVENGEPFPDWQQQYIEFMFYANDTSGDGFIDRSEFVTIQTLFGNNEEDSNKAFDKLSEGTDGKISKPEFESLWKEFFVSNDANSRGNFLFGLPPQ
ncbi:calexcitin-2-like [Pomacea canaliculata]|uniref:calexcitin-2-like n=1 Tax=Pomacea canaliculata TaxID=400727 RepID=UPI000D72ADA7|nr:calexcitin-2-like [Pomacea canaliculata]